MKQFMTSCIRLCFGDYWFDLKFLMPRPLIAESKPNSGFYADTM